jgi:hypothetical protein
MRTFFTLAAAVTMTLTARAGPPGALFEPPMHLTSEGLVINQREKLLYPSPFLLDLKGDGQKVLVIGDLWGKLRVYPPTGKRGDLNWGNGKRGPGPGESDRNSIRAGHLPTKGSRIESHWWLSAKNPANLAGRPGGVYR